ncbi:hypothetical protein [Cupriavidus sp. YR651]|uniref:hypothetical protein n=1 Tax=Cupriavidus sp. YR651 TaxID=1855315 RepID=UPI000B81B0D5|nr:hypothetical protein [Cupriavidus sp. YR651]
MTTSASFPVRIASRSPRRRIHPLFVAATLAITVATAGVAGAAVWRHQTGTRHAELAQPSRDGSDRARPADTEHAIAAAPGAQLRPVSSAAH